jgi:hypothetical protein
MENKEKATIWVLTILVIVAGIHPTATAIILAALCLLPIITGIYLIIKERLVYSSVVTMLGFTIFMCVFLSPEVHNIWKIIIILGWMMKSNLEDAVRNEQK